MSQMPGEISPGLEGYLEEVYRLFFWDEEIGITDVADTLEVSLPSAVRGLKRLHRPYEEILLTSEGKRLGCLVERNRILSEFIAIIGSECDIAREAEATEHYFSTSTIRAVEKMVAFLKQNEGVLGAFREFRIKSSLPEERSGA